MGFEWITDLVGILGPVFIVASPIISYSDQAYAMQHNKTSAGFSLDIPLIMLVASFFRFATAQRMYDVGTQKANEGVVESFTGLANITT